jgi:flagellar biosynthesis protein FlhG
VEREYFVNDQARQLRTSFQGERPAVAGPARAWRKGAPSAKESMPRSCRSIAVTSGKGGVGKTTISCSLAVALSFLNKKVCILDADLGLANIHIITGIAPKYNLSHLVNEERSLDEIISKGPANVDILPGASGIERMANLDPLRLELLLRKLRVLEERYDYLIIDTGAGIGKITTEFALKADMAVVIMAPEPASFTDAYAMVKVLYDRNIGRLAMLLNMVSGDKEGKETFDMLNTLVVKFMRRPLDLAGMLPFDKQVPEMMKRQKMALIENPRSLFSSRISACARIVSGVRAGRKESFFTRLFGL